METEILTVDELKPQPELIRHAADIIKRGGLVAFPTETVYGLGGNALDPSAAEKIYAAKGRPSDNPLIVHISDTDELPALVSDIPEAARLLMDRYWPGPMTLILPKSDLVPAQTTGGLDTVAVRMPSHPVAAALIRASGVPIAAPSANRSGRPSPTQASHVRDDLGGRIDLILDGGHVGIGVESTIIDVTGPVPVLLRPGFISLKMLEELLGTVSVDTASIGPMDPDAHPKAPGMKYRHYAPLADMTLIRGDAEPVSEKICQLTKDALEGGKRVGILCSTESAAYYRERLTGLESAKVCPGMTENSQLLTKETEMDILEAVRSEAPSGDSSLMRDNRENVLIIPAGSRQDSESVARGLFGNLREFDRQGVDVIYSEFFNEGQLGDAVRNRMLKAAGYKIIDVN